MYKTFLFLILTLLLSGSIQAQNTPVGTWEAINPDTGKPGSHIVIYDNGHRVLFGKIAKVLEEDLKAKNESRMLNLVFMKNYVKVDNNKWKGSLKDPREGGFTYSSVMWVEGNKLIVRGYVLHPILGKSVTWTRVK